MQQKIQHHNKEMSVDDDRWKRCGRTISTEFHSRPRESGRQKLGSKKNFIRLLERAIKNTDAQAGTAVFQVIIDTQTTIGIEAQHRRLGAKFRRLTTEWKKDTSHLSRLDDIVLHRAYQQIVGMGEVAIPFIFAELQKEPDHWFWALQAITGEDPVTKTEGKTLTFDDCVKAWLKWGHDHGYSCSEKT